jgi:oxygen-independent coproporphyrinogen-3 oxidase
MIPYSIYLHVPFCIHRCGYCDFNTYAGLEHLIQPYVDALCTEIAFASQAAGERLPVHTIFFGGGTPSLLPAAALERILQTIQDAFDLLHGVEITLEANPGTLSQPYLHALHNLGVNRLSIGMQSAHPGELHLLQRQHSYLDVIQSVAWARLAGFDNLNLDLIFGLPEQYLEAWQRSLELAIGLHPDHFSLYALTLEHGTPFGRWVERGLLSQPDPDQAADMYEWSSERLAAAGYGQYEISNWGKVLSESQPGTAGVRACRHNLQYWRNLPYLGFGAGAHGYANRTRTANVLAPGAYIKRLKASDPQTKTRKKPGFPATPATQNIQTIDLSTEIGETMMMGLRLTTEGVSASSFSQRFGKPLADTFAAPIQRLTRLGLLEWAGDPNDILRLTTRGHLLGNQVFMEFI